MKKTKLLLAAPIALSIAAPVILLTGCSDNVVSIGAPDVTCDEASKEVSIKAEQTVKFNFTLSKDLPTGVTLREVFTQSDQEEGKQWLMIVEEHPTITGKKFALEFKASEIQGITKGTVANVNLSFIFTNGQSEERKMLTGFKFTYDGK